MVKTLMLEQILRQTDRDFNKPTLFSSIKISIDEFLTEQEKK